MDIKRSLNEQEEETIYKAIDEFREYGKTCIVCPVCSGKLRYDGNYSSFRVLCENCGVIYSLRGI